jgi:DNA-binding NtrC family response regulator
MFFVNFLHLFTKWVYNKNTKQSGVVQKMNNRSSILIVDDYPPLCESLCESLRLRNYEVSVAHNSADALELYKRSPRDLVLLDVCLGDEDGVSLLPRFLEIDPVLPVIMITGFGTIETAVEAIKRGAFDYLQKPIKTEKLLKTTENALRMSRLQKENSMLRESALGKKSIITHSQKMKDLLLRARKLAASNLPILICGESGTGKEILAELIHAESSRSSRPLQRVNCAAFPESLLESELFGHERGAFTGAVERFPGVFERSDSGTLFLDEIGDMGLSTQARILRVLQNQEIRRVGGKETFKIDVRFITATNKNLEQLAVEEKFRSDLLYRLNAATLYIPPLRERKDEIIPLAQYFIAEYTSESGRPCRELDANVIEALNSYNWPGNIRELRGVISYACTVSDGPVLRIGDLPTPIIAQEGRSFADKGPLEQAEIACIVKVLREVGHNKVKAAEQLAMSRSTLYKKIKQYDL